MWGLSDVWGFKPLEAYACLRPCSEMTNYVLSCSFTASVWARFSFVRKATISSDMILRSTDQLTWRPCYGTRVRPSGRLMSVGNNARRTCSFIIIIVIRPISIARVSVCLSACMSVCLVVCELRTRVGCIKTAEPIKMPFGGWLIRVQGANQIPTERGTIWGETRAIQCKVQGLWGVGALYADDADFCQITFDCCFYYRATLC